VQCPGSSAALVQYKCPSHSRQPSCAIWDGFEYRYAPGCTVVSYDSHSTTCQCNGTSGSGRRLQQSSDVAQQVVDVAGVTGDAFSTGGVVSGTDSGSSDTKKKSNMTGIIIGVVVGGTVLFLLCGGFLLWYIRRQKSHSRIAVSPRT